MLANLGFIFSSSHQSLPLAQIRIEPGAFVLDNFSSPQLIVGSIAVGSLIGSIVSTATSGLQGIMGTATTALGANAAKNQVVSTAEEITAAVRRELTAGFDPSSIQKTLQGSLGNLKLPGVDVDKIGTQFEQLLKDSDLKDIANSDLLKNIDRQSFVDLISNRTDFSKQDLNKIADRLQSTWQQLVSKEGGKPDVPSQLRDLLRSATPEDLNSDELAGKLQQLVKETNLQDGNNGSFASQALQLGLSALLGKVLQNSDLSDLDVEKVSGQLNKIKASVLGGSAATTDEHSSDPKARPFSVIRADLENYLLFSPAWELSQTAVKKAFKDVVYDPQADPAVIRQELEQIDRSYFVKTLSLGQDLKPDSVENLANYLEEVRSEVLNSAQTAESAPQPDLQQQASDLRTKVETYLRDTNKDELTPDGIERDLKALFDDPKAGISALKERLGQFDRDTVFQLLNQRQDLDEGQINQLLDRVESVRTKVLAAPQQVTEQAKAQYEKTTTALAGDRISHFDRSTFVALLSQRG